MSRTTKPPNLVEVCIEFCSSTRFWMRIESVLAQHIKRIREERKLSQKALSELIGLSQNYVTKIESGKVSVTIGVLEQIAGALEVLPCDLIVPPKLSFSPDQSVEDLVVNLETIVTTLKRRLISKRP